MEFKIHPRHNKVLAKYSKGDLELARKFTTAAYKEMGNLLKACVLFGSVAKKKGSKRGDIDILLVIDDVTVELSHEMVQTYRVIVEKIVVKLSTRLHVTSLRLSTFWEYVRAGDPVAVNVLRDGIALIDTGFFDPLQYLLREGRIRPTAEAVWAYFLRAPTTLHNSKFHIMQATLDLYWACIDAAHAALMAVGHIPPSPDHVADLLRETLVSEKKLEPKFAKLMQRFYDIAKMIEHREVKGVTGQEYDRYAADAEMFVQRMRDVVESERKT